MVAVNDSALVRQIELHEGVRLRPYRCTAGKLTIGVGRNLEDRGITLAEARMLLANDLADFRNGLLNALPWVARLDDVRQRVLIDMAFNLGLPGLLEFKRTLAAVEAGQYGRAAGMMLESRWASQVGQRARRLSQMMRDGKDPPELQGKR
jgi:lysozyme